MYSSLLCNYSSLYPHVFLIILSLFLTLFILYYCSTLFLTINSLYPHIFLTLLLLFYHYYIHMYSSLLYHCILLFLIIYNRIVILLYLISYYIIILYYILYLYKIDISLYYSHPLPVGLRLLAGSYTPGLTLTLDGGPGPGARVRAREGCACVLDVVRAQGRGPAGSVYHRSAGSSRPPGPRAAASAASPSHTASGPGSP